MGKNDISVADLRKRLIELETQLDDLVLPLRELIRDIEPSGLGPDLNKYISRLQATAQEIFHAAGASAQTVAKEQQNPDADNSPSLENSANRTSDQLNYLLLFSVQGKTEKGGAISQDMMFRALCAFDPSQISKRRSFTSKLSRWKRGENSKALLDWRNPRDIEIIEDGKAEVQRLRRTVENDGVLDEIHALLVEQFPGISINI
ncbi:MAG: hypothetical protein N4A53_15370 [Pelagimonas sp.]|jgi:hypothetical protein|nr:hypothetical protein [Pelagimonas sp.]